MTKSTGESAMHAEAVLALYEAVADLTGRMLAAARRDAWDELIALEENCRKIIRALEKHDAPIPLSPEMRERKVQLIREVLAHDAEIRDLAAPRLARLANLLATGERERKIQRSYGA